MKPRIINGAFGIAIRSDHSVLLSQRNQPSDPSLHGKWQIPGGGQEYGETLLQSLQRELYEELGLTDVTILEEQPLIRFSLWEDKEPHTHVNLFIYCIDIHDQIPHINDEESMDWKWFTLDEVASLDALPQIHEIVHAAVERYSQLQSL